MLYHIYSLAYIEEFLHSWDKFHWTMGCIFFNVLLDSVCKYFVEDFCVCVHQQYWYIISFCVCDIFAFGIRVMVTSYNELASVSPSAIFWKSFRSIAVNSWLNA